MIVRPRADKACNIEHKRVCRVTMPQRDMSRQYLASMLKSSRASALKPFVNVICDFVSFN